MRPQETSNGEEQTSAQVTPISMATRPSEPLGATVPGTASTSSPSSPAASTPPPSAEEQSKARRRLALGGGLLTGAAVLHGWLYHVGYLTTLDVPVDVFPQDVRSLLLNVYNVGWSISGKAMESLSTQAVHLAEFACTVGTGAGLMLAGAYWLERRKAVFLRAREAAKRKLNHPGAIGAAVAGMVASGVFLLPYLFICLAITVLGLPLFSLQAGRQEGQRLLAIKSCIDDHKNLVKGCADVTFKNGSHAVGVYIASNDKVLALRVTGESLVFYEPRATLHMGSAPVPK